MATKVTLRYKAMKGGKESLFFDFYPPIICKKKGTPTRREYLKKFRYSNPKTTAEKQHNQKVDLEAAQILNNRANELSKPEIYTAYELEQLAAIERGKTDFIGYMENLATRRSGKTQNSWCVVASFVRLFAGVNVLPMSSITEKWCNDFKVYLQQTTGIKATQQKLSTNTASLYFNILKAALRQAHKEDYMPKDLAMRIGHIKKEDVRKEFLTIAELNALIKTDCSKPILKSAALFSALTGLRFSDIQKMTWNEIEHIEGKGYYLKFTQQKTKGVETTPISEQTYRILGTPRNPNDKVFEGLKNDPAHNAALKIWTAHAGIKKHITFHCFRHTFASLLSDANVSLAVISKMLGHRELATTQKYIHTLDNAKREAAEKIQLDF